MISYEKVQEALGVVRSRMPSVPEVALVLGSGLGGLAEAIEEPVVLPYEEIPHWPRSTAPGHAGRLVAGRLAGRSVVAMQGRIHAYEGYSMEEVTFPVRVLGTWGVRVYLATNASGGINVRPGGLCLIQDHINFMGKNPLVGDNEDSFGPRFPDMTYAYDPRLGERMKAAARTEGIELRQGVYMAFSGPSFETPAEIRMARTLGADVVGMSTVPEVIVANHMGMRVCALSCAANYAAGIAPDPLSHEEVLAEMRKASGTLTRLILRFLSFLPEDPTC